MADCINQTVEEIVTEISMSTDRCPWLVMEGRTDSKFFVTKHLPNNPKPIVATGWENVVGIIAKIIEENIAASVFGFIDRDYREHLGIDVDKERIVVSDFRDLEISLFESGALHRVLIELGSEHKLPTDSNGNINLDAIKEKIYSAASIMGRIRFFSLKYGWGISFRNLDFSKFIDSHTLDINKEKLLPQLNSKSSKPVTDEQIETALPEELPSRLLDCKYLNSGHDVFEILGIALRKLWGTNSSGGVSCKIVERHFRIGYSNEEFANTDMCNKLHELFKREPHY